MMMSLIGKGYRVFGSVFSCLLALFVLRVLGDQTPANHPKIPGPGKAGASGINDQVARAVSEPGTKPVPIRNFIDELIFGR